MIESLLKLSFFLLILYILNSPDLMASAGQKLTTWVSQTDKNYMSSQRGTRDDEAKMVVGLVLSIRSKNLCRITENLKVLVNWCKAMIKIKDFYCKLDIA